jgi:uncharacterized protein (DUF433 family)
MDWRNRIVIDPKILVGKPVIRGTRMAVELVVDLLAAGWNHQQLLESYPHISEQDILACQTYAGEALRRSAGRFRPVPVFGEPLSRTLLRDRGRH